MRGLEEILQDRLFLESMEGKTKEEILVMFAAEGYELTDPEAQELVDLLAGKCTVSDGELSEDRLEAVAGGKTVPVALPSLGKMLADFLKKTTNTGSSGLPHIGGGRHG